MKIVIADDEPTNRLVTFMMLKRLGHEVQSVSNGAELLQHLQQEPADLILLDIYMPVMDGVEAAREIARRWGDISRPVLIALTASDDHRVRQVCVAAGMDDYILKPIDLRSLREVLARWSVRASDPRASRTVESAWTQPMSS